MPRYFIRSAAAEDENDVRALAHHLNTVNLPDDAAEVREILETAERSFSRAIKEPKKREYLFVLEDRKVGRVIGTSMIFAQHGRREEPHIYFQVFDEEKYSSTLDRHFVHRVLRIHVNYSGPTEIGGLVLLPEYRRDPERLGLLLSMVRFLYIAAHRSDFRDEIIAELLPPLEPDGTSHLWEALGRHFTGMSYQEADRTSKKNKEFVRNLFPNVEIYATLLPEAARGVIGKVGPQTRGVEKLLRRIGFRYSNRIDPFDGGPHFAAKTADITLVGATRRCKLAAPAAVHGNARALVAVERSQPPIFRCIASPFVLRGEDVILPPASADFLALSEGDEVTLLPLQH